MLEIFQQAKSNLNKIAIHSDGNSYTFSDLLKYTDRISFELLKVHSDLNETRVAFMVQPGFNYVATLWSIWQSGGVAVPLCIAHPLPSLEYVLEDSTASILIISKEFKSILTPFLIHSKIRLIILEEINKDQLSVQLPEIELKRNAMILYTSGTTNKPKGVVTTHENIQAQVQTLIKAWGWTKDDHVICVLPLHHVHGIINVVCCSMWVGASCTFESAFSAQNIFEQFKEKNIK